MVIRYRTYAGVIPTIDVYDPRNVLRVNKGIMQAVSAETGLGIAVAKRGTGRPYW